MPAPAVIPAPRAYINAVAVKGFVVELGATKVSLGQVPLRSECATAALLAREHSKQNSRECFLPIFRMQRMHWGAPVHFTVINEV